MCNGTLSANVKKRRNKFIYFPVHDSPHLYKYEGTIWFWWIMTLFHVKNKLAQSISCNLTKYALYHNFHIVKCCEWFYNFTHQVMWNTKGKSFTSDFVVNVNISEDVFFFNFPTLCCKDSCVRIQLYWKSFICYK